MGRVTTGCKTLLLVIILWFYEPNVMALRTVRAMRAWTVFLLLFSQHFFLYAAEVTIYYYAFANQLLPEKITDDNVVRIEHFHRNNRWPWTYRCWGVIEQFMMSGGCVRTPLIMSNSRKTVRETREDEFSEFSRQAQGVVGQELCNRTTPVFCACRTGCKDDRTVRTISTYDGVLIDWETYYGINKTSL